MLQKSHAIVFLVAFAILALATNASALVYDKEYAGSGTTNNFPMITTPMSYQAFIPATELNSLSGNITEFGFRYAAVFSRTWPDIQVWMGETTFTHTTLSTTFAANYNATAAKMVYSGAPTLTTTAAYPFARFVFQTPYTYSGVNGLIFEVRVNGASTLISGSTAGIWYWSAGTGARIYASGNATATTGTLGTSLNHGFSMDISQGADLTWNGSSSTAWSTASNWTPAQVPGAGDNVTIPDGATTNFDPTFDAATFCGKLKINAGGILNGGTGKLTLKGDWENLGVFNKGTSTVEFNDANNQNVTDAANNFNNVIITNGRATFKSPILATHTNTYTVNSTGEMAFGVAAVNISGINLINNGTMVFGASGVQQVVTTKANHALKKVLVSPPAAADRVTFVGTQNYTNLTLAGAGPIVFPSSIVYAGSIVNNMTGILTASLLSGSGPITLNQTSTLTTSISIGNSTITYTGTGTTTLNGSHTAYFTHGGNGNVTLNGSHTGTMEHYGKGTMTITGNQSGGDAYVDNTGALTINGSFSSGNIEVTSSGTLTVRGVMTATTTDVSSNGRVLAQDNATINTLNLTGTGSYEFSRDLTMPSGMSLAPSGGIGNVLVYGNLLVTGNVLINPSATAAINTLYVIGNSTISGNLTLKQSNARFDGTLAVNAVATELAAILDINSPATTTISTLSMINASGIDVLNSLTVSGAISVANDATVSLGSLLAKRDISHTSTKPFKVLGSLTIDGTGATAPLAISMNSDLECVNAIFNSPMGVILTGVIKTSATTASPAGVDIGVGTALTMNAASKFILGNAGWTFVSGTLKTNVGTINGAPRIGPASATTANRGTVVFNAGSTADINGMIFERVGHPNQAAAIRFDAGSTVTRFDNVRIPDCASPIAAIDFNTSAIAPEITGLSVGGTSPKNIDATDVSGITITFLKGTIGGGSLYGVNFEIDPNVLLFWDASPVVLFTTQTQLTVAYATRNYNNTIAVHGGNDPYIYSLGNHPSWISINALTGQLFGTPALEDIASVSVEVLVGDSTPGVNPVSKIFNLEVEFPPYFPIEFITPAVLPDARADEAYATTIEVFEGQAPYAFSLVGAQSWLAINSESGEITGIPPLLFAGPVSFGVRVVDSKLGVAPKTKTYTINVTPSGYMQIVITTPNQLPDAIEGQAFGTTIQIQDGLAPHTFALINSPSWLFINPATGYLSGTAPLGVIGLFALTVQVSDVRVGSPIVTKSFTIKVVEVPYTLVTITSPALLPVAGQGQQYEYQITVTDGLPSYIFSLENAPIWLSIDPVSGILSGYAPGAFSGFVNFRVIVRDNKPGQPGVAKNFALEVLRIGDDPVLVNTPPVLYNGTAGSSYYIVLAASGGSDTNYTWFIRPGYSLPAGLSLNGVTGIISGTPEAGAVGAHVFQVGARDSMGNETFQVFSLTIDESPSVGGGLVVGSAGQFDLPERGAAGGCAIASGPSLWMLALMFVLGGLVALRATRRIA